MQTTLEDFISETLTQIVRGIDKAKEGLGDREDWVSPPISALGKGTAIHDTDLRVHYRGGHAKANLVRFDVALHAAMSDEGGGKGGVRLAVVSADFGTGTKTEEKAISRVQFEIPLVVADYAEVIRPSEEKPKKRSTAGSSFVRRPL